LQEEEKRRRRERRKRDWSLLLSRFTRGDLVGEKTMIWLVVFLVRAAAAVRGKLPGDEQGRGPRRQSSKMNTNESKRTLCRSGKGSSNENCY